MSIKNLNLEQWSQPDYGLGKEEIRYWLEAMHSGDRGWLTKALGLKNRGTVDHSFSTKGFKEQMLAGIKNLMKLDMRTGPKVSAVLVPDETSLIPMTTGLFEKVELARGLVGSPSRPQFYATAIEEYADKLLAGDPSLAQPTTREVKRMAALWKLNDKPKGED